MIVGSLVVVFGQPGKVAEPRPGRCWCQVVTGRRVVLTSCHGKGVPPLCSLTSTSLRASGPYLIMASAGCSGQGPKVCGATMVFRGTTEDDRKGTAGVKELTHLCLNRATPAAEWYDGAMVTLLTIEPISERHGGLIVEAFNRFFIDRGGQPDGGGHGYGHGDGGGHGYGHGYGDGGGNGNGNGNGYGYCKCPEEWRVQ